MNQQQVRDEIRLQLTGELLEIEIEDSTIDKIINSALVEIQRYLTTTYIVTVPFSSCIDFKNMKDPTTGKPIKVSTVVQLYRTKGYVAQGNDFSGDPFAASMWQLGLNGTGFGWMEDTLYKVGTYNTLLQVRNTLSTDLAFKYDKREEKLYINTSAGNPQNITIEFIPRIDTVEELTADWWIDVMIRLAVAKTKVILGRIRTRYTQANALWTQDGQTLLQEGTQELEAIREYLDANTCMLTPID